ncbi:uncharacterized protein LOC119593646 [Penaeus monodon]|uniref:uncharacterized protein LOC119593646 n=1 Tax=Penaeus monodon TaxID=6687 RepID=UPI0018A78228|nr:uncharacterized protein LOC119593646 [Penaeus monodon]
MRRYVWRILVPPLLLFSLFAAHVTPSDPQHGPQERAEALDNGLSAIPNAAEVGEEEEDLVSVEEEASDLDTLREELNQGHGGSGTREEGPGGNDLRHSATRLSGGAEESLSVTEGQRRNATGAARRWGSHPLPPLEEYIAKRSDGGASWTAYFHDQAIAIIQQTHEGTVLNCTLQEVIQVWEQREALAYLGRVMPLVPVPFQHMVHLVTLCGTFTPYQPQPIAAQQTPANKLWWLDMSALQGILPGTLWCGMGDQAATYHQLGPRRQLDSCCRAHDHCPIKLRPMMTRYGLTNYGFKTRSHCSCDLEFYRCLKAAGDSVATMVGQVYFNYLKMECIDVPGPKSCYSPSVTIRTLNSPFPSETATLSCLRRDTEGGCRFWLPNPKGFTTRLQIVKTTLNF